MSKIQLNKNQKEVLFIVALFLVPFLDPGFALLLGLILSLTIGHPFLAINSRITHILLQISVVGLGFGMNVEQAIEAGKTGILFTIFSIVVTIGLGLFFTSKLRVNRDTGFLVSAGTAICGEVPLPPWPLSLKPKTRTSPWPWEPFSCLTPWHYSYSQ